MTNIDTRWHVADGSRRGKLHQFSVKSTIPSMAGSAIPAGGADCFIEKNKGRRGSGTTRARIWVLSGLIGP